jgi:methylamine dehydrogenase accessory protein MauD
LSSGWLASYIALWALVMLLVLAVLGLTRQVGLLHLRMPPFGARDGPIGPPVGKPAPEFEVTGLDGKPVALRRNGKATLLVFLATDCAACDNVVPSLRSIAHSDRRTLDTILISLDGEAATRDFVKQRGLASVTAASAPLVAELYGATATPFAFAVDPQGIVRGKGVVNHIEHLESLVNAISHSNEGTEAVTKSSA